MISMVPLSLNIYMNKAKILWLAVAIVTTSLAISCKKKNPEISKLWGFYTPNYFPASVYTFDNNTQTYQKFELGRALFYDTLLSSNNTVSCASCHASTHAFAGHNTALSAGVNGLLGTRNAPAIFNMAWSPYFMWDGGINNIEVMPIAPLTNHVEMNESLTNIVFKVGQSERYKKLLKAAYGTEQVTDQKILKALTQFMVMIISDNSKYDKVKRGEDSFTETEQLGYSLFQQKCSQCHTEPLFTDYSFRNNGLDSSFSDVGRFLITQQSDDLGKFKVPSLRNVLMTYPYMHDGRFYTINQVLDHYNSGVRHSGTLDPMLSSGIPLSATEKSQLIAFLKTLNDYELLDNSRLAEPKQ